MYVYIMFLNIPILVLHFKNLSGICYERYDFRIAHEKFLNVLIEIKTSVRIGCICHHSYFWCSRGINWEFLGRLKDLDYAEDYVCYLKIRSIWLIS